MGVAFHRNGSIGTNLPIDFLSLSDATQPWIRAWFSGRQAKPCMVNRGNGETLPISYSQFETFVTTLRPDSTAFTTPVNYRILKEIERANP